MLFLLAICNHSYSITTSKYYCKSLIVPEEKEEQKGEKKLEEDREEKMEKERENQIIKKEQHQNIVIKPPYFTIFSVPGEFSRFMIRLAIDPAKEITLINSQNKDSELNFSFLLESQYELYSFNLWECHCSNLRHARFEPDNLRTKFEAAFLNNIINRFTNKSAKLRILSIGYGGALQDLVIIAQLAHAGYTHIEWYMVETNPKLFPQVFILDSYVRHWQNEYNKDINNKKSKKKLEISIRKVYYFKHSHFQYYSSLDPRFYYQDKIEFEAVCMCDFDDINKEKNQGYTLIANCMKNQLVKKKGLF